MAYKAADGGMFVGREAALNRLETRVDEALHGRGAIALIEGEAGIGKTSLALAIGSRAQALGATLALGRCAESGLMPALSLWRDVLSDLEDSQALTLATLPAPLGSGPAAQTAWHLMRATAHLLAITAAQRPLALLLEDLHWSDEESLELLDVVAQRIASVPMLLVATYRSDGVERGQVLQRFLPRLQRDRPVEVVRLGFMTLSEVASLVETRLGPCSPDLAAYLHARAEGHPLFLVELLRDLRDRQMLPQGADQLFLPPTESIRVPEMLRGLLTQRVVGLGEEVEALLDVAAVAGREWDLGVVERVLGWDEPRVLRALESALEAKLVEPLADATEEYRFTHSLIRDVLYTRQMARRRTHIHAAVAAALEESRGAGTDASSLAHHCFAAQRWEKAASYSLEAGDAARARYASRTALEHYQRGLDAMTQAPSDQASSLLVALYERVGEARTVFNQLEPAEEAFRKMLSVARASGDRLGEGRALFWLSYVSQRSFGLNAALDAGEAALRTAHEVGDQRLLALTHWNFGHLSKVRGEVESFAHHMREAERIARAGQQQDVLGWCLQNLATLSVWRGEYAEAQRLATQAVSLSRETHDALNLGGDWWYLGLALGEHGRYEQAREALQAGLDHAEESGERRYMVRTLNTMGWLHAEMGDADGARRWDEQALDVCRAGQGDPVREAERYSLLNLATDDLLRGDTDGAERHLRAFEGLVDQYEYVRFRYLNRYQLVRAELSVARGDLDLAIKWAEQAAQLAAEKGVRKNALKARLVRGRALLALGRAQEADSILQEAVDLADELEHGSLRWQSRLWAAHARTAAGEEPAALELAQQGLGHIERLAGELRDDDIRRAFLASPLVQQLQRAAAPVESHRGRLTYPAGLTQREVEVLRLVAQGASDRSIAETLVISVKTVNAHVSRILGKTGCPNRAAAAAFALRHGLV